MLIIHQIAHYDAKYLKYNQNRCADCNYSKFRDLFLNILERKN